MAGALGGFLSGFDQAGGAQAVGGGLNNMLNPQTQGVSPAQMDQAQAQLQGANAASDAANPDLQAALHPMADPSHPVWNVLGAAAGGGGAMDGMQNGGVVRLNSGSPTKGIPQMNGKPAPGEAIPAVDANSVDDAPTLAMQKGGLVPEMAAGRGRSMGQGITPGNTEGQPGFEGGGPVQGYADGGAVDMGMPPSGSNFMAVPGQATPPVTGRAAGLSTGLAAGMAEGHNLREAWQQRQQREAAVGATNAAEDVWEKQYRKANGMPDAEDEQQGGLRSTINNFMHHLIHHSHDSDGNTPNQQLVGQAGVTYPQAGGGAVPVPAGAAAPAQGTGVPPPAPQAAAPAQPGAAPPAGAMPPSPAAQAGAKGTQIAAAATGNPAQAQATGAAASRAATEATASAAAGTTPEQQAPPKASLDPRDVIAMERAKMRAANAATMAGMDGTRVYNALSMQQTAHFQGQYLQQVALAQQALTKGNYDDMEKYLRNANYYLPNGQDLEFKKASAVFSADQLQKNGLDPSTRVISNPFYGLPGHTGDPQYVPLNPMTLGAIGQNALDPRAFTSGFQEQYKLGVEAQANLAKAQGAAETGRGRLLWGQSQNTRSMVDASLAPSKIAVNKSIADKNESTALYMRERQRGGGGGDKITTGNILSAQRMGEDAARGAMQGELETVPAMTTDPKTGQQIPNISPGAGRSQRNPNNIAAEFKGFNPSQQEEVAANAGNFHAANARTMSASESARAAALLVRDNMHPGTHFNPQSKQQEDNVVRYSAEGSDGEMHPAVRIWDGQKYITAWTTPNVQQESGIAPVNTGGGAPTSFGGSSEPTPAWVDADNEPAQ